MPVQRKERQRMVQGTWIGFHNLLPLGKKDPIKYDASPSTVAQVIYAKYVQAIPLDRQVKDWERAEFPMSKATLCN